MARIKGKAKVSVKKSPVKAGSTHTKETGGIFTSKVAAIVQKKKTTKK